MQSPNDNTLPAPPTFSHNEFISATLSKLRMRLLDLTSRNPLISFKHSGRSRRHLRVIDELPDFLYQRLNTDSVMSFKSLGEEPSEPEDEKTLAFRRALDAAKLEDEEYRQKLAEAGDDPGEKLLARLETELRARLRERIGMPSRKPVGNLTAADVARARSLDPAFDLPVSPTSDQSETPSKHRDSAIQTLLFEQEMDRTLLRIREQVRLSIEEMGVNPLFCVFGFLEWYEDAHSETPLHGPLLLYPLQVERELVRGHYQYTVRSTGEPPMVNVALIERLKRDFEIELPPFNEDEDTPEKYLILVQKVIERHKAWKVRRWITVGLFSFARIAMYQDLHPARWESQGGLDSHPVLGRIISGGSPEAAVAGTGSGGESDQPDSPEISELAIPLIADADSSQVAAIREVLAGHNLVIEGPPGTGKSQTITNIVAAALGAGKTVLFLAEKMAALTVVKDRLKDAGLDQFCLELHSTKGSRKETFGALAGRLQFPSRNNGNTELKITLARLETIRTRLGDTAAALAKPAGNLGITTQEILWQCQRLRGETTSLPSDIDELTLAGADGFGQADLGRIVSTAVEFQRARARITQSYGSVSQHPWYGIASRDIDLFRAEDLVRQVGRLGEAARLAEKISIAITSLTGWKVDATQDLRQVTSVAGFPSQNEAVDNELVARMAAPQTLAAMEEFLRDRAEYAFLAHHTATAFRDASSASAAEQQDLVHLRNAIEGAGFNGFVVSGVGPRVETREREAAALMNANALLSQIAQRVGLATPVSREAERALVAGVQLAGELDARVMALRAPNVVTAGASDTLHRAVDTSKTLRAERERLASPYVIEAAGDVNSLRRHASALRGASLLSFLSPAWWRARSVYRTLSRAGKTKTRLEMAAAFEDIASLREGLKTFADDVDLGRVAGAIFHGADSDLTAILTVADWADRVRATLAATNDASLVVRRYLFEQAPEQIESLAAAAANPHFDCLIGATTADPARNDDLPVNTQTEQAKLKAECARRAKVSIERLNLRQDWNSAECSELSAELGRMHNLAEGLNASLIASSVLGNQFCGSKSDVTRLESSAEHVRAIGKLSLPPQVRDWLMQGDASQRVSNLRTVAIEAAKAVDAVQVSISQLEQIVPVDYLKWLRALSPWVTNASELCEHATRCANDAEGLQMLINDARLSWEAREAGLGPLLDLLESKHRTLTELGAAARRIISQSIARAAIARSPALANFNGDRYEALRNEFRELDHKLKRLQQAKLANDLARRAVDRGNDIGPKKHWTGCALVVNEVSKQQHIPTRELLDRAGKAVQQLMPCFMMSPLSVAQFLKPGGIRFDIIVMDEASQLRPQDAIGAIARGAQVVIWGARSNSRRLISSWAAMIWPPMTMKRLPPTSLRFWIRRCRSCGQLFG